MNAEELRESVALLGQVRKQHPLVHCMTNHVVKNFTANVLLALGAAPAMVEDAEEAAEFAPLAGALLVNLGTLDRLQCEAISAAVGAANRAGRPWVLDPVAVGVLRLRTAFARELLQHRPTVIRGNASEIIALSGGEGGGRGVDSGAGSEAARQAARELSRKTGAVVLITGATDLIVSSHREVTVGNGDALLTRVTGVGCAMGAINAALLAVSENPFAASVVTALFLGIAGERAAAVSRAPGSFQVALLDAFDAMQPEDLLRDGKVGE